MGKTFLEQAQKSRRERLERAWHAAVGKSSSSGAAPSKRNVSQSSEDGGDDKRRCRNSTPSSSPGKTNSNSGWIGEEDSDGKDSSL